MAQTSTLDAGARQDITELYARYAQAHDQGQAEEFADLFTEDGVFNAAAEPIRGRTALVAMVRAATAAGGGLRHLMSAIMVDPVADAPDRATGAAYVQVVAIDDTGLRLITMGRYTDEFVLDNGRWRFRSHHYTPFTGSALRGAPIAAASADQG
jgi:uncharacterized protein (TIGR02246 family)